MIGVALVSGLAAVWIWTVLNDEDGIFHRVNAFFTRWPITRKWMMCPWCSGSWFAGLASIAVFHPLDARTVVTALAAAGVTGLVGSYIVQENE